MRLSKEQMMQRRYLNMVINGSDEKLYRVVGVKVAGLVSCEVLLLRLFVYEFPRLSSSKLAHEIKQYFRRNVDYRVVEVYQIQAMEGYT